MASTYLYVELRREHDRLSSRSSSQARSHSSLWISVIHFFETLFFNRVSCFFFIYSKIIKTIISKIILCIINTALITNRDHHHGKECKDEEWRSWRPMVRTSKLCVHVSVRCLDHTVELWSSEQPLLLLLLLLFIIYYFINSVPDNSTIVIMIIIFHQLLFIQYYYTIHIIFDLPRCLILLSFLFLIIFIIAFLLFLDGSLLLLLLLLLLMVVVVVLVSIK